MSNKYWPDTVYDRLERSFFDSLKKTLCPGCAGVENECPEHGTVIRSINAIVQGKGVNEGA